ncbi:MAG: hypothetical protein ACHQZR_00035 [Candidatus Limnocylindrales bacterium]
MSRSSSRWLTLTTVLVAVALAACSTSGGSPTTGATAPPTTAATAPAATVAPTGSLAAVATATAGAAASTCPTAAAVNAALGVSLTGPLSVPTGDATQLPTGATGVSCEYPGTSANVIIEMVTNTDPSLISKFIAKFPVPPVSVTGVGDQASSFVQSLNNGKDNEEVVATKGSTLVAITATATPASLAQVEALVTQLL